MADNRPEPPLIRLERSFATIEELLQAFARTPELRTVTLLHLHRARICAKQALLAQGVPKIPQPAVRRAAV